MRLPKRLSRATSVIRRWPRTSLAIAVSVALGVTGAAWWLVRTSLARSADSTEVVNVHAAVQPASRPTTVITFEDGCMTANCHASISIARVVHAPVANAACDVCHAPDTGGHMYPVAEPPDASCTACHDIGQNALVRHKAISGHGCLACHDSHRSETPGLLIADSVEKTCAACHPKTEGSVRHQPYGAGACDACHDPHASDSAGLLRGGAGADHCRTCHAQTVDSMASAKHSHSGVEGSCLACHSAHASDHKGLLNGDTREQCTACHQEIGQTVAGAVISHDGVLKGKQCLACHVAHASENAVMLRDDQSSVCMGCHDKSVLAADGRQIPALAAQIASASVVHGPVKSGDCAACHSVHGGNHARLLKQVNPAALVGGFDIRNYALCFSCHDQSLVLDESATATQFRNGEKNLHRVHVQFGDRSRSCATCHAVHSGDRPRLIAETVAYEGSNWMMPMRFELTADGGSCGPGCHEPLSYSRSVGPAGADSKRGVP